MFWCLGELALKCICQNLVSVDSFLQAQYQSTISVVIVLQMCPLLYAQKTAGCGYLYRETCWSKEHDPDWGPTGFHEIPCGTMGYLGVPACGWTSLPRSAPRSWSVWKLTLVLWFKQPTYILGTWWSGFMGFIPIGGSTTFEPVWFWKSYSVYEMAFKINLHSGKEIRWEKELVSLLHFAVI